MQNAENLIINHGKKYLSIPGALLIGFYTYTDIVILYFCMESVCKTNLLLILTKVLNKKKWLLNVSD